MSDGERLFRPTPLGGFMELCGPAWHDERPPCQKKLCFVATNSSVLAEVLGRLAERPDCFYVKYSVKPRDGMYLGRCFLMEEREVGAVWADYKMHPRMMCTVQDDDFTRSFRPATNRT